MKIIFKFIPIILFAFCLLSCQSTNSSNKKNETKNSKVTNKNEIEITKEDSYSECYISKFIRHKGKVYVIVDYIARQELDVEKYGEGAFKIVNNNPKLRTFIATKKVYPTCDQESTRTLTQLETKFNEDTKLIFTVKVVNGELEMFYIDTCSG